jgi:hypothetical protein
MTHFVESGKDPFAALKSSLQESTYAGGGGGGVEEGEEPQLDIVVDSTTATPTQHDENIRITNLH